MVQQTTVPAPPIQEPIVGSNGRLSPMWANWFNKFYKRAGAGEVTPVDDLETEITYDFDALPGSVARAGEENEVLDALENPVCPPKNEDFETQQALNERNYRQHGDDIDLAAALITPPARRYADEKYIPGMANAVINGGCMASSRPSATITNSYAYGPIDLLAVKADGTVAAGTISQATGTTSLTQTAHACFVENCTLTGSGAVYFRHRIESKIARRFVGQIANFSARVYHDVGSAVDAVITINKADSADDFSSVTQVATKTISVPDTTNHTIEAVIAGMGDCSNGIEIEVKMDTGAITTKDVYCGDLQLTIGEDRRDFEIRPLQVEQLLVRRYLYPVKGFVAVANTASVMQAVVGHVGMRAAPTYSATGAINMTDGYAADRTQSSAHVGSTLDNTADNGRIEIGNFSGMTGGVWHLQRGTSPHILASAEL